MSQESLLGYILRKEWAKSRETMALKGLGLAFILLALGQLCMSRADLGHLINMYRLYNPFLSVHAFTRNAHRKTHWGH